MSYPSIVLHLDPQPHLPERIDFAIHLAKAFNGHLTGVAASDRNLFEIALATGLSFDVDVAQAIEEARLRARARAVLFGDRAVVARFADVDSVVDDHDDVVALVKRSRCCDLMILARPEGTGGDHARVRRQVEDVLLQSVAPTLLLPPGRAMPEIGGHAVVGWNGRPEAVRAVMGALPMLRRARQVTLLQCDAPFDRPQGDGPPDLELPRAWLARHGVNVDAWIESTAVDPGYVMMDRAQRVGADLIVMGAWGHWRWSERLFGGATQNVLRNASVPVLMCH